MPAPSGALLAKQAVAAYGMPLGPEALKFVEDLMAAVEKAWKTWQDSIQFGTLVINGAGVGAWAGIGGGGIMTGGPFMLEAPKVGKDSPELKQFVAGLTSTLSTKFGAWPPTYKFSALNYTGTSGATPVAPGPVSAQNVPTQLAAAGAGGPISGIADMWALTLTPPAWMLDDPMAKSKPLIKSISKAIETAFQSTWLATTMANGSAIATAGAPGGVVAGIPSQPGGKLV